MSKVLHNTPSTVTGRYKVIGSDSNFSMISAFINELPNQELIRTEDNVISYAIIKLVLLHY